MFRRRYGAVAVGVLLAAGLLVRGAAAAAPAEMRVTAPSGTQAVSSTFEVTVSITRADAKWAGYTDQIAYDSSVLLIKGVTRGGIANCDEGTWANPQMKPTILSACVFQSTNATGVTEKIQVQCLKDGTSEFHLITPAEDKINGSMLFDESASAIPTDLVDATITCGGGGPLATVPIPTNPSQSDLATAAASAPWTPVPPAVAAATIAAVTTAIAQGTAVPEATQIAQQATLAADTAAFDATAAAKGSPVGGTPRASGTAAQGLVSRNNSNSGGSSNTGWIIGGIIAAAVLVAAAGGGVMLYRRRTA